MDLSIERSEERDAAIRALLPQLPRLGWSRAALLAGLEATGQDPAAADWLFPRGVTGMIEAWADLTDREMAAEAGDLTALRTPARIRRLIERRLTLLAPHREALRGAVAILALPWNLPAAGRATARSMEAIWSAAGDVSADLSRHTRRATLAAVYAATLAYWLCPRQPDLPTTLDFLDRRLATVAALGRRRRCRTPTSSAA
jgi:ubiquinone biosynthesis protein COQ9